MSAGFLGAARVPRAVHGRPLSFPFVYGAFGYHLFALPLGTYPPNPLGNVLFVERFTDILVIISLTGSGRPRPLK